MEESGAQKEKARDTDETEERKRIETVFHYHEETKHHFHRYARSSGFLDWKNQPLPWRIFEDAPSIQLNTEPNTPDRLYANLYYPPLSSGELVDQKEKEIEGLESLPIDKESISCFLFHSLALSAWKKHQDSSWSLRVNPSSGNLHPTEGYVILPSIAGLSAGQDAGAVYHYLPLSHSLERRCVIDSGTWQTLIDWGKGNVEGATDKGTEAFFVGLTSIHWREAWKYGERAYRYCNHDVGHALGALRMAGSLMGWQVFLLNGVVDSSLAAVLGVNRVSDFRKMEGEEPELLALVVGPQQGGYKTLCHGKHKTDIPREVVKQIESSNTWKGTAKQLSKAHVDWDIIRKVSEAAEKHVEGTAAATTATATTGAAAQQLKHSYLKYKDMPAEYKHFMTHSTGGEIIRQRRSALDFDGTTSITRGQFFGILSRVVPALTEIPWDVWPPEWGTKVHLVLFVHRVEGLPSGLYFLLRDEAQLEDLKGLMKHEREEIVWGWEKLTEEHGAPPGLPLYFMARGDVTGPAAKVSCEQEIAADGVFSLGMIADFEDTINTEGAHAYRRLFWETGLVGQVLYLEAEGQGIRATGIGCFFDDAVHSIWGLKGKKYQSLYHFTLGGPVEDKRLRTLHAYKAEEH